MPEHAALMAERRICALVKIRRKTMRKLMLTTALVAITALSAAAQDMFRGEADPMSISASKFIGMRVYASEAAVDADEYAGVQDGWNDIGEINDVILSRDGKVQAVLVDVGGFLGVGERQVALDMSAVRFVSDGATADAADDFFLVVNATKANIESAPAYGMAATEGTTIATDTTAAPADDTTAAATDTMAADTTAAPANGTATATDTMTAMDGYVAADPATLTTEALTGITVYGPNDESVGEISDFVLDDSKAIKQVIVDVGGFLGMGEKPVALDLAQLKVLRSDSGTDFRAYVEMTKEQLETLPKAEI
jgi:sporulation protein YlmC with PRC-barrel domain